MKKTVCIVGSNEHSRHKAPWKDTSKDIWVLNEAGSRGWPERINGLFQIHMPSIYRSSKNVNDEGHWDWLKKDHPFPIYMQEVDPDIPSSVKYPLEEIQEKYLNNMLLVFDNGSYDRVDYFTSTFPYAFAMAMHLGYETIEIHGIEMASGTEYQYQRDCFMFWAGIAGGHGTKIEFHSGHNMFSALKYGYEGDELNIPLDYFEDRMSMHNINLKSMQRRVKNIERKIKRSVDKDQHTQFAKLVDEAEKLMLEIGEIAGRVGASENTLEVYKNQTAFDRQVFELAAGRSALAAEDLRSDAYIKKGHLDYVWNVWKQTNSPDAKEQIVLFTKEFKQLMYDAGARIGFYQENRVYMAEIDKRIAAAGGKRALQSIETEVNNG